MRKARPFKSTSTLAPLASLKIVYERRPLLPSHGKHSSGIPDQGNASMFMAWTVIEACKQHMSIMLGNYTVFGINCIYNIYVDIVVLKGIL